MGLFLYSANCWLSFVIGEKYYGGTHYVWCSDQFDNSTGGSAVQKVSPPTSNPRDILRILAQEVINRDRHSPKIASLKQGLLRGLRIRQDAGEVGERDASEIQYLIEQADIEEFGPLLYIISEAKVRRRLVRVPIEERANPMSNEFKIERLRTKEFDVLDIYSMRRSGL